MKPGYITFGKYKRKDFTLEEACFKDFSYLDYILREFDPGHWAVEHLEHLFQIARARPIQGPCEGDHTYKTNCGRTPDTFSIPGYRDRTYPGRVWRICSDPKCREVVRGHAGGGGLVFYRISFEAFRHFVKVFKTKGEAAAFGLQLARAWGIVRPNEKLTK